MDVDSKTCKSCGVEKPLDAFGYYSTGGLEASCKDCRNRLRMRGRTGLKNYLKWICQAAKSHCKRTGRAEFHLEPEHLYQLWEDQGGRCALSGVYMTHHKDGEGRKDFNASMDRIHPAGPYTRDNVRLVCDRVNMMRHTLSENEFWWWVKNIHAHSEEADGPAD
jgi:hypothetical protein